IRNLKANNALTGHWSLESDRPGAKPQSKVILQRKDAANRDTGCRLETELGNRRPLIDLDDARFDIEAGQRLLDGPGPLSNVYLADLGRAARIEHAERGQPPDLGRRPSGQWRRLLVHWLGRDGGSRMRRSADQPAEPARQPAGS